MVPLEEGLERLEWMDMLLRQRRRSPTCVVCSQPELGRSSAADLRLSLIGLFVFAFECFGTGLLASNQLTVARF